MSKKPVKGGSNTLIKNNIKCVEESILDIISDVSKRQYSADFREPVDVQSLGLNDYYDIIKKPMDLTTLKNNFLEGKHKTIQEVWNDFGLIVENCKTYNRLPDHPINAKADQMKSRVDKSFEKLIEDLQAAGIDTENYELKVDETELKAKEEKKKKIKLDGLDSKNILIGGDKRLFIPPGSLSEKKLFELQIQDLQMMQQQARNPSIPISQLLQNGENEFQPNLLKMSQQQSVLSQSIQYGSQTPSIAGELPNLSDFKTETSILIEKQKTSSIQAKKFKDTSSNQAKIQELQIKVVQINEEKEQLQNKKADFEAQRQTHRRTYIQAKKQRKQLILDWQNFENEENNLVNPENINNVPQSSNLNGSSSKKYSDLNDGGNSGVIRTPQKREQGDEKRQDHEENDDDDDDIVIKKKGNIQDDSAQKSISQQDKSDIKSKPSTQTNTLNKEANSSSLLNDSKVSSKSSHGSQKMNGDQTSYQTPTKSQMNNQNFSQEKTKLNQNSNLKNSDSNLLSTMKDGDDSEEEEFKPTNLNTVKQQPANIQSGQSQKFHGLKPTSSTASSASLQHKQNHQHGVNGEKHQVKKSINPMDQNNSQNSSKKEMATPEKKQQFSSSSKKDTTPEKLGNKSGQNQGLSHSHSTHGKINSQGNPQKLNRPQGQTNGQSSQNNLSPMQSDKQKKMGIHQTPPKSSIQNSQKSSHINGNQQIQKKSSENQIKVTIGGEQISRIQEGMKVKKTDEGIKIKNKDQFLNQEKGEDESKITNKILTLPSNSISIPGSSQLPAPELKETQSMKAALLIQMGQDKKNKQIEEFKKTEEQKRLEEQKKRDRILKKKEMKLLQNHQQKQAAAAIASGNTEGVQNKSILDSQKIILMKGPSINADEGSNLIKITLDPGKTPKSQSNVSQDISFNSRQIYDKIIPPGTKSKKQSSLSQDQNSASLNGSNLNYNKIKINVGGSPLIPTTSANGGSSSNIQPIQNYPVPQISVGGERVDFKFAIDKKSLKKEYENMVKRKQLKYRKLLEVNLTKMQKVTNWMIKEWGKQKKDIRSETLDYFKDILNERIKIKDNLDVRKIQLFLKMFLYRLRDFYKDLKTDYIDKLKTISEKLYKIGSRAIVYKTPLNFRDNPKNAAYDMQVSNTQILDESHPLKKLQEEILEIEREMKLFRRMLSRDIQKYQEQTDTSTAKAGKKLKSKDDPNSQNMGEQDNQGGYMNAGQGFYDQKDMYGGGDKEQQFKQSEIFSYFLEYNKSFEKQINNLQKIQTFLTYPPETTLLNHLLHKIPVKQEQNFDVCETTVEDDQNNQINILDYIKKKRKISPQENYQSEKSSNKIDQTKIEEDINDSKIIKDEELNDNLFEGFSMSFNLQEENKKPQNIFSDFGDEESNSISQDEDYKQYQKQKLTSVQNTMRSCNNGSELNQLKSNHFNTAQIQANFDIFSIKKISQMINAQLINRKIIFDLYKNQIKRRRITEIKLLKIHKITVYQKKDNFDQFNQQFFKKIIFNSKFRQLDDSIANNLGINGLIDITIPLEIYLEKEFSDKNNSQTSIDQNQNQDLTFEFQIKNSIGNVAHAYFSEAEQIINQLQLNCQENSDIYSFLCPEDVESVVSSFRVENYLQQVISHNPSSDQEFSQKQQYDSQSACSIRLINHQKIKRQPSDKNIQNQQQKENQEQNQENNSYYIELSLFTPINSLRDFEIKFNGQDLFTPIQSLQNYQNRIQQQIIMQQKQQQQ